MPDCDHIYELTSLDNAEAPDGSTRTMHLTCTLCGHQQRRLTQRSLAAINAEAAKG